MILGPLEIAVMERLWEQSESTVREVVDHMGRPLAYTTVLTTLSRLYEKGLVERRRPAKAFLYSARAEMRPGIAALINLSSSLSNMSEAVGSAAAGRALDKSHLRKKSRAQIRFGPHHIQLDRELLQQVRRIARRKRCTLADLVVDGLRRVVEEASVVPATGEPVSPKALAADAAAESQLTTGRTQ
jgi:predicted transcriptional regulator